MPVFDKRPRLMTMTQIRPGMTGLILTSLLAGCASLPSSGPTANALIRGEREQADRMGFSVVDVSADTLPIAERAGLDDSAAIEAMAGTGRVDLLGPGDVLQVNIFEVGVSLFGNGTTIGGGGSSGGGGSARDLSARDQSMEGVTVDQAGYITLPYIGRIRAAGRTTDEVRQSIVRGLGGKSQAPQALVTVRENVTNTVFVSGLVSQPGRERLSLARERILDAVAAAGGIKSPATSNNAILRITRAGRTAEAYLERVTPGSRADLILLPGDRIEILQRDRSFTAFGATSRVSEIKFEHEQLSLSDAVARAGGPDNQQADPAGVFVFRYEKTADAPNGEKPLIYRLDMTKPSSYFLAQRFMMQDKDVIYIANARSNQTRKLMEIVNLLTSPFIQARAVTR